jgi:hypothetical protein
MKSGKQRRAELDAKRKAREAKAAAERAEADRAAAPAGGAGRGVPVNRGALAPHTSYGEPEFVTRGSYLDLPFVCVDCGWAEVWTAAQQKWWYEVAGGDVFTTARRCRACRRRERERAAEARQAQQEGLARKRQGRPGGAS